MPNFGGTQHFSQDVGDMRYRFAFSFAPNGASDPVAASSRNVARILSIVHSATGKYTVTFADALVAADITGVHTTLGQPAPDGSIAAPGVFTPGAAGAATLIVWTLNASGTAADIAANADTRVSVTVTIRSRGQQT